MGYLRTRLIEIKFPGRNPTMFKIIYKIRKPLFIFPFTLCLTLFLYLPWVSANKPPPPKPQPWQIDGIVAALEDSYPKVKGYAFQQLAGYDAQDLKAVLKKPQELKSLQEDLADKIAQIVRRISWKREDMSLLSLQ